MLTIALAGNPNSGKTTLFNVLTGSTAHVGNWPGVTVDKREGVYKTDGEDLKIVDLPGIYSLSPYTLEEKIARGVLLNGEVDCLINVVDATNLERNLYLTTQLIELSIPIVMALNMQDVLKKRGDSIDVQTLQRRLGVPVVEISALKQTNIPLLMQTAKKAAKRLKPPFSVLQGSPLGERIEQTKILLQKQGVKEPLFHAIKLLEKDELAQNAYKKHAFFERQEDFEAMIADARYQYITAHFSPTLKRGKATVAKGVNGADKWLTHKWLGVPIFILVLFCVFHVTFSKDILFLGTLFPALSARFQALSQTSIGGIFFSNGVHSAGVIVRNALELILQAIGNGISKGMQAVGASEAIVGLICDGVWGGLSSVLSFLPQILVLFLCFCVLEDSGYMARVAFMLDKPFRKFGVSGRAVVPMIMGFGCSVPAIINTRTLFSEREREATIRVIPFFTCSAKVPVVLAVVGGIAQAFQLQNVDLITYGAYLIGIVTAFVYLFIANYKHKEDNDHSFLMELPAYHVPALKNVLSQLFDKAKHFIKKAFTIITLSCIVVWFLSCFGWDWKYLGKAGMNQSILASIGKLIQPLFTPLGFGAQLGNTGWVFAVAALTGLIAKEDVVATLGTLAACIITNLAGESKDGAYEVAQLVFQTGITLPALLAFIAFNLLTVPCFAAVATARGELPKKSFFQTLWFWFAVSYLVSALIYTVFSLWWTAFVWGAATVAAWLIIKKLPKRKTIKIKRRCICKHCNGSYAR